MKRVKLVSDFAKYLSLPVRGRGLKHEKEQIAMLERESLPVRGRGLKLLNPSSIC